MPTISQVFFTAIFLHQFSCFRIAEAHPEAHLSAKMAFSMTSRLR